MRTDDVQATEGTRLFSQWLTSIEVWKLQLPGMPGTRRGVQSFFVRLRGSGAAHLWRDHPAREARENGRAGPNQATKYHYLCLPPEAIAAYEARYKPAGGGSRSVHLGTVLLCMAEDGALRAFVLREVALKPSVSAGRIRDLCVERFGAQVRITSCGLSTMVRMPPLEAFRQFVASRRAEAR